MLSRLDFETVEAAPRAAPNRADVACFVGRVTRRMGAPLPAGARAYLVERGWIDGPWQVGESRLAQLWQIPVVVESWEAFDALFAWNARRVRAGGEARCATYLGAAVRSFFANGGRRAVVIRTGDPWPYLGGPDRFGSRDPRIEGLVPGVIPAMRPFDSTDPRTWMGVEHLYGLSEVSHLSFPDMADLFAVEPPPPTVAREPDPPPEVFVECSEDEPAAEGDEALRLVAAPRLDGEGYAAWAAAVAVARDFLVRYRREALLVASLPLARDEASDPLDSAGARAGVDWCRFLEQAGVFDEGQEEELDRGRPPGALVQLAWPWLRTTDSDDLPQRLEPAEGLLAGLLAANALARGTFRSIAGTRLARVVAPEPMPDTGLGPDSPTGRLAERVCLVGPEPDGIRLLSDVTSAGDPRWRPGGVSRLMAVLLRAARRTGEVEVFQTNGPETWDRIRRGMEGLLEGFLRAGAFRSSGRAPAYEVRCDRTTMSQNDLDHGRVRVEVTVQPAAAVERITVSLELTRAAAGSTLSEVA